MKTNNLKYSFYGLTARRKIIFDNIINSIVRKQKERFRIIDLGCGDGSFLFYLVKKLKENSFDLSKIEFVGIDRTNKFTENKNIKDCPTKINFLTGDVLKINNFKLLERKKFDYAVCSEILEHILETDVLIKNVKSLLTADGIMYLVVPNLASYHARLSLLMGYQPCALEISDEYASFGRGFFDIFYSGKNPSGLSIHHVRGFTLKALKEFIRYHGFKIIQARGIDHTLSFFWRFLPSLSPVIFLVCEDSST